MMYDDAETMCEDCAASEDDGDNELTEHIICQDCEDRVRVYKFHPLGGSCQGCFNRKNGGVEEDEVACAKCDTWFVVDREAYDTGVFELGEEVCDDCL